MADRMRAWCGPRWPTPMTASFVIAAFTAGLTSLAKAAAVRRSLTRRRKPPLHSRAADDGDAGVVGGAHDVRTVDQECLAGIHRQRGRADLAHDGNRRRTAARPVAR